MSDARRRASRKYDKENTFPVTVKLNKNTDADIVEWLKNQPNKQGYIKALIKADMKKD